MCLFTPTSITPINSSLIANNISLKSIGITTFKDFCMLFCLTSPPPRIYTSKKFIFVFSYFMPINFNSSSTNSPKADSVPESVTKAKLQFELITPKYQFSDLVLPQKTFDDLKHFLDLRKHQKEIFTDWGFSETHKYANKMIVNLYGESGTGKTMSAHAIANALGKKLILVNYGDIESKYVGETPKNIKAVFDFAKENDAILFFDEADAILSRRVTNMTSATDTSVNQTRSVMLNLLNDYNDIVLFATNFISNYDPAFMRRILMHIEFTLPDEPTRKLLFSKYIPDKLPNNINLDDVAKYSESLSGSDIANVILLSAFSAKSKSLDVVSHSDVLKKIDTIKNSKKANIGKSNTRIEAREVSEEYVKQQLNGEK